MKFLPLWLVALMWSPGHAQQVRTVFLEELTWTEVRDALASGYTTILIPTAGTEQNGPHMALGKHNFRMKVGAELIARRLGNALVAPIISYVPEGDIAPPTGHMRYPGTISVPAEVFASVLEYAARSLKHHGFRHILLIGDSGPNQAPMESVAETLNGEWKAEATDVLWVSDWYTVGGALARDHLRSLGATDEEIGTHAGLLDTSLLLATAPQLVRTNLMKRGAGGDVDGVTGDPTGASAELGADLLDLLVGAAVEQIRAFQKP